VDAAGTVHVAWVAQDDSVTANVYLARLSGDGPVDPVRVNHLAGDAAPHLQAPAQVATGPGGLVYVAWQSTRPVPGLMFGAADIRLARSEDGGLTFQPAVTVNDDAGRLDARHSFHDIEVTPEGTVYVSWIDARHRDSARVMRAKRGRGGHAHADPDEPTTDIRVARSTYQGRTFSPGVVVDTNSCTCCRTAMASGPDGTLYVAWRKLHPGGVNDIVVARSNDQGRAWSTPVKLHDDGWVFPGCPHAGPDLRVDAGGAVHAVWYTGAPGREGLYYTFSTDGGASFRPPVTLVSGGVPASQARLATAGPDAMWIAWEDRRADPLSLRLAWASSSGRFRRFDSASFAGASPAMAASAGTLAMTWLDGETVRVRFGT
jgi:hypothetical protein